MKNGKNKVNDMPTSEKAMMVAGWLSEKKAENIVVLDVEGICPICEAMIVVSARNSRQAKALADYALDKSGEQGFVYLGLEGYKLGQWVLLDLNDVLVHIFLEEFRGFYNIEGLWSEGKKLPLVFPQEPETSGEDDA